MLHEIVELRVLLHRNPYLLAQSDAKIRAFARLPQNRDAHVYGLEVEYGYLQGIIQYLFDIHLNIGALLQANLKHPQDWDDLFDTNLPFFAPSPEEIRQAKALLGEVRKLGRRLE